MKILNYSPKVLMHHSNDRGTRLSYYVYVIIFIRVQRNRQCSYPQSNMSTSREKKACQLLAVQFFSPFDRTNGTHVQLVAENRSLMEDEFLRKENRWQNVARGTQAGKEDSRDAGRLSSQSGTQTGLLRENRKSAKVREQNASDKLRFLTPRTWNVQKYITLID